MTYLSEIEADELPEGRATGQRGRVPVRAFVLGVMGDVRCAAQVVIPSSPRSDGGLARDPQRACSRAASERRRRAMKDVLRHVVTFQPPNAGTI